VDTGLSLDLRGRTVLVTGGSRGVGRATAILLARAGASVGIGFHSRSAAAEETVAMIRSLGREAWAHAADVATEAGVDSLFDRAREEFATLDVVVVNAGIWPPEEVAVAEMTTEQWSRTLRANLDSAFFTVRRAVGQMTDGGSIVMVSSTAGQRGEACHADYAASKGAMISFTKSVAVELAPRGIRVNCVAPGWIDTEMVELPMAEQGRSDIERGIPLNRIASADDVGGPILFLCSPLARHITGEILNVNGGSVLCG
jgi:3-oxoacyl-[acyl-carrier protein] reductase